MTTTYNVPDISCDHCKMSIEGAVGQLAGIASVSVDVPTKTVHVDMGTASPEAVVAAIEEQGYAVAN